VLWRLAQEGRLKDVEYLTAVSGGGYIASAFASHCLAEGDPRPGEVQEWYTRVVSKTIQRMQVNAGDFVRDACANPCYTGMFSGLLPRFLDLPILLVVVVATLLVHPVMFIICILTPFTIFIEAFFGGAMRASFCAPPSKYDFLELFSMFSNLRGLFWFLIFLVGSAIVIGVLRKILPSCKLRAPSSSSGGGGDSQGPAPGRGRLHASMCFLMGHASAAFLKRASFFTLLLMLFVTAVPLQEQFQYSDQEVRSLCSRYIHNTHCVHAANDTVRCGDLVWADIDGNYIDWHRHEIFADYRNHLIGDFANHTAAADASDFAEDRQPVFNALCLVAIAMGVLLFMALCLLPIIGSQLLVTAVSFAGPIGVVGWALTFIQYVVFGPVTLNQKGILGTYDQNKVDIFFLIALALALVLLPIYEDIRAGLHLYYWRCLRQNFFADGEDSPITELKEHPYSPFLLLTGTSNDYQPPGDDDKISEISFSCLHTGGEETGYFRTPEYRYLGKCAAISGAGCLDAISLSMNDALSLRFWLEVLNLSWGDYILLDHVKWLKFTTHFSGAMQGFCIRFFHQLPQGAIWVFIFWMLVRSWQLESGMDQDCLRARSKLTKAGCAIFVVISMSFFSFLPFCDLLALSPMVRQIQQLTRYFFVGDRPPRMLYCTDGGVKDCTSIVQLLWRRRERILLVLAAADPNDELNVLKSALEVARNLKLASFYNPEDPRKDIDVLFTRYKEDKEMRTLHLGISYSWDKDDAGSPKTGHLFIVKNRLPPSLCGSVRPPISESEVVFGGADGDVSEDETDWDENAWAELKNDDLGPFGCCDCCHTSGLNCGPKFPHGTFTGYLYLSPQWCSSLMRLGHAASKDAVDRVCSAQPPAYPWEREIPR